MRRQLAVIACVLFAARTASAEEATCKDTYEQSQQLMKPAASGESTLLRARSMLQACTRMDCKEWLVSDCSRWLGEVEARVPTVVFAAKNTAGRDLTDVRVLNKAGQEIVVTLDGHAIDVEPGAHTFVFVTRDGKRRELNALVREGAKSQGVTATFDASPEELARAAPPSRERPMEVPRPLRWVGYGTAGLGLVGLGIGGLFGLQAISKKNEARCDAANLCDDPGALDDSRSAARIATAGFVAGGILVAAGVALVLFAPGKTSTTAARGWPLAATW